MSRRSHPLSLCIVHSVVGGRRDEWNLKIFAEFAFILMRTAVLQISEIRGRRQKKTIQHMEMIVLREESRKDQRQWADATCPEYLLILQVVTPPNRTLEYQFLKLRKPTSLHKSIRWIEVIATAVQKNTFNLLSVHLMFLLCHRFDRHWSNENHMPSKIHSATSWKDRLVLWTARATLSSNAALCFFRLFVATWRYLEYASALAWTFNRYNRAMLPTKTRCGQKLGSQGRQDSRNYFSGRVPSTIWCPDSRQRPYLVSAQEFHHPCRQSLSDVVSSAQSFPFQSLGRQLEARTDKLGRYNVDATSRRYNRNDTYDRMVDDWQHNQCHMFQSRSGILHGLYRVRAISKA
jgi:hypothetical protein